MKFSLFENRIEVQMLSENESTLGANLSRFTPRLDQGIFFIKKLNRGVNIR